MKTRAAFASTLVSACLAIVAAGCGGHSDVPEPYVGLTNPFDRTDTTAVTSGEALYAQHCASCHGDDLTGNGPASSSFDPPPSDLTDHTDHHPDDYLIWKISAGEGQGMPAFDPALTLEERWQVLTYVHNASGHL